MASRKIVDVRFHLKTISQQPANGAVSADDYRVSLLLDAQEGYELFSHVYCGNTVEGWIFSDLLVKYADTE